jgi:hypothetical protein
VGDLRIGRRFDGYDHPRAVSDHEGVAKGDIPGTLLRDAQNRSSSIGYHYRKRDSLSTSRDLKAMGRRHRRWR